ncbi:MAG: hypothetical protein ACNA8W_11930, partial [Bradymonadaceae bacterium]
MSENPFDELDLNPRHDVRTLTAELQERARRASPEDKPRLQKLWRELTQRHADRIRWALLAHPRGDVSTSNLDDLRRQVPPSIERIELDQLTESEAS